MSFRVTIANDTLEKSVESVSFNINAPSRELGSPRTHRWDSVIITGKVGFGEDINVLSNWASISAMNRECYKEIIVEEIKANQLVRKFRFSKAFVISYSENYTDDTGIGHYSVFIRNIFEQDTEIINDVNSKTIEEPENRNVIEEAVETISLAQAAVNVEKAATKKRSLSFTNMFEKQKEVLGNEGGRKTGFKYKHNPSDNAKVFEDAVEDPDAVYGYRPSKTGSVKAFADDDWSDHNLVEYYREKRIEYHKENDANIELVNIMRSQDKKDEEIARAMVERRNQNRLASYIDEDGSIIDQKKYNQALEHCKSYEYLRDKKGKSDLEIIDSSKKGNAGFDACTGLYDDYYHTYNIDK